MNPEEDLIIVRCPDCKVRLSFKPVANYRHKQLTCPKCRHSDLVQNYIPVHDPTTIPSEEPSSAPSVPKQETLTHQEYAPKQEPEHPEQPTVSNQASNESLQAEEHVPDSRHDTTPPVIPDKPKEVAMQCLQTGEVFPLHDGINTIGRLAETPKAEIMFTDDNLYMSRLHATITVERNKDEIRLVLRDANSANGTRIDGKRLKPETNYIFKPGDKIMMGKQTFVCVLE